MREVLGMGRGPERREGGRPRWLITDGSASSESKQQSSLGLI